ncbi:MAG: ABC transporter ATP-binding protein [Clostridia bacterium]|nr:ABC transporter ATP-binding protein [Clostridia bacterium]
MLEIKDLSVGYGKKEALHQVNATFETGKLTVLLGPNGSGKSTLLKAALGLLSPWSGEVTLDGRSIAALSRKEIAKKLAFLAQSKATPDMTVSQLVLHGRFPHVGALGRYTSKDREIAQAAIEKMGLSDKADQPLSALSGGMKQNAYIAMALSQDTPYILLDEPTTYLDIAHQLELMQTLGQLTADGRGIVCVMHDLPLALSFADSVAVLCNRKIAITETPEAVCASGILEQVFGISVEEKEKRYHYRYP